MSQDFGCRAVAVPHNRDHSPAIQELHKFVLQKLYGEKSRALGHLRENSPAPEELLPSDFMKPP